MKPERKLWRAGAAAALLLTMTVAAREVPSVLPSSDAADQYSLGYPLPEAGGTAFHKVDIQPLQDEYRVRSRGGYYASFDPAPDAEAVSQ